ncbi:hypothetical protein GCK72_012393 [Caenorhabditis remanei]|uniref:Uncharacterized protein n=1 Tax=Caenorhabditis remanei TaxID=31234 RepID=A0A6A5GKX0_CAERE|nr:hypothetical protein GCK72_012393 [Caenorhabditis remanei]KAF1755940.1 hypothetical protein GCK72_012393 [Caenorhabditis remanei]
MACNNVTIVKAMVISEEGGRVMLFTPKFEENLVIHNQSKKRQPGELFEITVYSEDYHPRKGELDETTCSGWKVKLDGEKLGIQSIYLPSQNQKGGELLLKVLFHNQFPWFGETGHYYNGFFPFAKVKHTNSAVEAWLKTFSKEKKLSMELQMGRDGAIAIGMARRFTTEEKEGNAAFVTRYQSAEEAGLQPLLRSPHPYVWLPEGQRPLRGFARITMQQGRNPQEEDSENEEWEIVARDDLE